MNDQSTKLNVLNEKTSELTIPDIIIGMNKIC